MTQTTEQNCVAFRAHSAGSIRAAVCWMGLHLPLALLCACSDPAEMGERPDGWEIGASPDGGDVGAYSPDGSYPGEMVCGGPENAACYGIEAPECFSPIDLDQDCDVFRGDVFFFSYQGEELSVLPSLRVVEGGFDVYACRYLQSLRGAENLEIVKGELQIRTNRELRNLNVLSKLSHVGKELLIKKNARLVDLEGLENLRSVGELTIQQNERLQRLSGLSGLERVDGRLYIDDNPRLFEMSALAGLRQVDGIFAIVDHPELRELDGLENVRSVSQLSIIGNSTLRSLRGLSGLERVEGNVEIWGNPEVAQEEIDAFLSDVEVGGEMRLSP